MRTENNSAAVPKPNFDVFQHIVVGTVIQGALKIDDSRLLEGPEFDFKNMVCRLVDEIPKNNYGEIQKTVLRKRGRTAPPI